MGGERFYWPGVGILLQQKTFHIVVYSMVLMVANWSVTDQESSMREKQSAMKSRLKKL